MFNSLEDIVGKSDFELPWHKDADKYIEQDQLTLKGVSQFNLDCLPRTDGSTMLHLCQKVPLYNEKGKITGVGGIGLELTRNNYKNIIPLLAFAGLNIENFIATLHKKNPDFVYGKIDLSKRQAQIISLLLRGYSAELTAKELKLSKRTIESYLIRLKEKLECKNKYELINKAFELGFIDLMFMRIP